MADVTLSGIRKSFGETEVIKCFDLAIEDRELVVFVGPSGCGKSTLLRLIAGLEVATAGQISIAGRIVDNLPPSKRGIAMVFQTYGLYPHMTAAQNIGFNLRLAGDSQDQIRQKVAEAARVLHLDRMLDRFPRELSGGQRQRVAIGRAIVRKPDVFLFDEPLSNLDASLRVQMRVEIARLHRELEATMIYVTHDQVEAMTLAERIVVLNEGAVEQVGTPLDLYHEPANIFVAGFIGSPRMNLIPTRVKSASTDWVAVELPGGAVATAAIRGSSVAPGVRLTLGVRPENLILVEPQPDLLGGEVIVLERLGSTSLVHVRIPSGEIVVVQVEGAGRSSIGETVSINLDQQHLHLFQANGLALQRLQGSDVIRAEPLRAPA